MDALGQLRFVQNVAAAALQAVDGWKLVHLVPAAESPRGLTPCGVLSSLLLCRGNHHSVGACGRFWPAANLMHQTQEGFPAFEHQSQEQGLFAAGLVHAEGDGGPFNHFYGILVLQRDDVVAGELDYSVAVVALLVNSILNWVHNGNCLVYSLAEDGFHERTPGAGQP